MRWKPGKKGAVGIAIASCLFTLLCLGATAQAKQIQQYFYSGELFSAGGSNPAAIAFDGVNQKVLVVGNGDKENGLKISKFNPNGDPAGFSALANATSFNTGLKLPHQPDVSIAVDESGTATNGNFYIVATELVSSGSQIYGYDSDGTPISGFPFSVPGACGVAVAPDGFLWVASQTLGSYSEYTPSGKATGKGISVGSRDGACQIAIDPAGNFYVGKGEQRIAKYDVGRNFVALLDRADPIYTGETTPFLPRLALDRGDSTLFTLYIPPFFETGHSRVLQADTSGNPIVSFGGPDPAHFSFEGLGQANMDLAVDSQTHDVYVLSNGEVKVFSRDASVQTVPTASVGPVEDLTSTSATLTGTIDPDGVDTTDCHFEWGAPAEFGKFGFYHQSVPCSEGNVFAGASGENVVTAPITGLSKGINYNYRLSSRNANGIVAYSTNHEFRAADAPAVGGEGANHITTDAARIAFTVNTNGADSKYHVEIGTDTNYGADFPVPDAKVATSHLDPQFEAVELVLTPQAKTQEVSGLSPSTEYHYQIVAENAAGRVEGVDHVFKTFSLPKSGIDSCQNAQERQQTSAAGLLDCRAYELVSAPDTGGYDVRSDLTPGISALPTSAGATDAALYSMQSGTIPGIAGHPTNRGADSYVATRGKGGWSTRYVGIPADNPFATGPFASPLSGFDSALDTFAFGGEEICAPCFANGSTDVPLRLPNGELVPGMAGSIEPGLAEPLGTVRQPISPDGSHFVFATAAQFEPGGNSNGTDATVYSRDLNAATTEVVSTDSAGATLANGDGIAALAVSEDGSRVVIGEELSSDAAGNDYYRLYLHIAGSQQSVDLTPGTTDGALFDGMTKEGTEVFFTTADTLSGEDTDSSLDVYRDEVSAPGAVAPQLISAGSEGTGNTDACSPPGDPTSWNAPAGNGRCNVVAFAGGAGVASEEGSFYFLSPETLAGGANGIQDQPNLYVVAPGSATPHFVATIDSSVGQALPSPTRPILTENFGGEHGQPETMAVDQSNGDLYLYEPWSSRLFRYTSSGAPADFSEGPGTGTNQLTGFELNEFGSELAVDNSGGSFDRDLFVSTYSKVSIFSQTGKPIGELSGSGSNKGHFEGICGVAVDHSNGDVYVAELEGNVWRYSPTSGTLPVSDADYTVTGINPAGMEETCNLAADAGNVYIAGPFGGQVRQFEASSFTSGSPANPAGDQVVSESSALSIDPATHEVYVDTYNKILVFNAALEQQLTLGVGQLANSQGVAVNASSRHVYASRTFGNEGNLLTEFGYDLAPYEPIHNPAIIHAVHQAAVHDSSDFQITPNGAYVAFASSISLTGYPNDGRYEIFRFEPDGNAMLCVSCSPTLGRPESDATLTASGLSLLEDGRVFFTTGEQLTLRDTNEKKDAYEWENGVKQLISTGTSPSDSALLSVSADGKDVLFFTRQKLVPEDNNGNTIRLYAAREVGGYAFGPPTFQCAASDECHGAGTQAPRPLGAATTAGTPGQFTEERKPVSCAKGKVRRRGKCVRRNTHKRGQAHKRTAKAGRGGGK